MTASTTFPIAIVPAPLPIPIATSEAAVRDGVTFLDLPAEIRNATYAFALVLPDPLMVASAHLYRVVGDGNSALVATKQSRKKGRPHKPPASNLASVFLPGVRIFRLCRQVYHEATSVFFSQNRFAITRPRCSPWNGGPEHDDAGVLFTDGADWVLSLGSQLSKLNTITLDLDALCLMHGGNLELLPLLIALWNRDWSGKLEFKSPGAQASRHRRCDGTGKVPGIGNPDLTPINQMIASLVQDDLRIRKHAWALCHVAFHCQRLEGVVLFRLNRKIRCKPGKTHKYNNSRWSTLRSDGSCLEHHWNFRYENGKCVRITERPPQLQDLAAHIRQQIFGYVLYSRESIIVDLSSGTRHKLPALLCTNTAIRTAGSKQYFRSNTTSLLVKYEFGRDDIATFHKMACWMYPPLHDVDEDLKDIRRESVGSLVLDIEALDGGPRRLEDLKINTAVLWHRRVRLGTHSSRIQLEVRFRSESGDDEVLEEASFSLEQLLTNVSRALRGLYDANMGLTRSSMLEIFVDGRGEPTSYLLPATMKMLPLPRDLRLPYTTRERRQRLEELKDQR